MSIKYLTKLLEDNAELILISSVSVFIVSLILFPLLIISLPKNYFIRKESKKENSGSLWKLIIKNILGVILIIIGALMLILPGPGIIVMLIGLMLMSFPSKKKLKNYFLSNQTLRKELNWIRQRADKEAFVFSSGNKE